jgi:hypothetical protein
MSMNIGTAKRIIRSFSYKTVDIPDLIEAAITLYDHASELEAEIDCECARWTAATANCPTRTREVLAHLTKLPDALSVIREAHKCPSQVTDPHTLADACEIALEVEELFEVELRAVRAAWFTASDEIRKKRVGGHQLVEQVQDDGTHHTVGDVRLKSGDTLYLLTHAGWILGQYRTALDRRPSSALRFLAFQVTTSASRLCLARSSHGRFGTTSVPSDRDQISSFNDGSPTNDAIWLAIRRPPQVTFSLLHSVPFTDGSPTGIPRTC